jgi:hypothetical protein
MNKKTSTVTGVWAVVSGLGWWLADTEFGPLIGELCPAVMVSLANCAKGSDDGERVGQLVDLVGLEEEAPAVQGFPRCSRWPRAQDWRVPLRYYSDDTGGEGAALV